MAGWLKGDLVDLIAKQMTYQKENRANHRVKIQIHKSVLFLENC